MSGADAVRVLLRLGFVEIRQRGSHVVLRRGGKGCVVPLHRELKLATLLSALKQAGVTPEDFLRACKR